MPEFSISVNDNDSFMCSSDGRVFDGMKGLSICDKCHYRTDFEYVNDDFEVKRKIYDLSSTYDGYYIASLKFKEFILREGINGVDFVALKKEPMFFAMFVRSTVQFDAEKRNSRSENLCSSCGNFESFIGATPAYLKEALCNDICRTNIMFGSGNSKHPLLVVSEKLVNQLKREKIQGLNFEPTRT
ncbi:hypothetical protein LFREDSHE_16840 [Shewanella baltica]